MARTVPAITSLVLTGLLVQAVVCPAQDTSGLIMLIREGHRGARASIRTIHARYQVVQQAAQEPKLTAAEPTTTTVEWWQDGDQMRWTTGSKQMAPNQGGPPQQTGKQGAGQSFEKVTTDYLVANGEAKMITRRASSKEDAVIRFFNPADFLPNELWAHALFVLPGRTRVTLETLLEDPSLVNQVEPLTEGGRAFYRMSVKAPAPLTNTRYELVIDPSRNFLVKSCLPRTDSPKAALRFESRVVSFREHRPGVHFPVEVEGKTYRINQETRAETLLYTTRTQFHSVEVNQAIDPEVFNLHPKTGTPVVDYRDKTSYVTGEDGKPKGDVHPAPESAPTPVLPTYSEEPRSDWLTVGIILTSVAVALALAVFMVRRRKRAA